MSLAAALRKDLIRVSSELSEGEVEAHSLIRITVVSHEEERSFNVQPDAPCMATIRSLLRIPSHQSVRVCLGEDHDLEDDESTSFCDQGVEDGARLIVTDVTGVLTADEAVASLLSLNPHCSEEALRRQLDVDPSTGAIEQWGLWGRQLTELPDSFGRLRIRGSLDLGANHLSRLPENFGNMTVGKELDLADNRLTELPASMSHIKVGWDVSKDCSQKGGHLYLWNNQLRELPEGFRTAQVSGSIKLSGNPLAHNDELRAAASERLGEQLRAQASFALNPQQQWQR